MQQIAISADLYGAVAAGEKEITIRRGERDYQLGSAVMNVPSGGEQYPPLAIDFVGAEITTLRHVRLVDLAADGYESLEHALNDLHGYYPDLTLDSVVTVVRFKLES